MPKTRLQKAIGREFKEEHTFNNINESIKLAKEISVYEVINPTGKNMAILAEIISRLKDSDELEIMEIISERVEA